MIDRNGKTVRVGDIVEYYVEGKEENKDTDTFVVKAIKTDNSEIPGYASNSEARDTAPYALLFSEEDDVLLEAPFFPYEIRKLEIEELI